MAALVLMLAVLLPWSMQAHPFRPADAAAAGNGHAQRDDDRRAADRDRHRSPRPTAIRIMHPCRAQLKRPRGTYGNDFSRNPTA
ncbi:MAG: hypothetical protein U0703_27940 [Anaerolineae bacterium]